MALAMLAHTSGLRRASVHVRVWSRQFSKGLPHSDQELLDVAAHESQAAARLAEMFRKNPDEAAKLVSGSLSTQQRAELLCLLCRDSGELNAHTNKRLQALRVLCPHVLSARADAEKSVLQRIADGSTEAPAERPPTRALMLVALASGIPFVGFGFLDNVIMITAGEEIDVTLGVRFGLSTLAAAGLGNLVADVAGIGFANSIEQAMRKTKWTTTPPLTSAQRMMKETKWAKGAGATVGVMIGCLLGLVPLFLMDKAYR